MQGLDGERRTGDSVRIRAVLAIVLPLALSACANESTTAQFLPASVLATGAGPMPVEVTPVELPQKTMSDRVLAAIALERVTGLKPDPARFAP